MYTFYYKKKYTRYKSKFITILFPLLYSSLTFSASCTVNVEPLNFGNYQPFSNKSLTNNNNIYILCNYFSSDDDINLSSNKILPFVQIQLSTGSSGTYTNRNLVMGSNHLNYNLYTNNRKTKIWGDGSGYSHTVTEFVKHNREKVVKIYGQIPAGQSIPPGIYTDNIIVTVNY